MAKKGAEKRKAKMEAKTHEKQASTTTKNKASVTTKKAEIKINFGPYTNILDQLKTLAEQEFRPLDMQIIYILNRYLNSEPHPPTN